MSILYTENFCRENWTAEYNTCQISDNKMKYYRDQNACGTTANLPSDNSSLLACDYCTPQWDMANSSCSRRNVIVGSFNDSRGCYAQTGLASDANKPASTVFACDYCLISNCSDALVVMPQLRDLSNQTLSNETVWKIDARDQAQTLLEITAPSLANNVSILHYSHNIF